MRAEVFLDTAYAIALSSPNDLFHQRAVQLADELKSAGTRLVTTRAILLEIGNALSRQRYRRAAVWYGSNVAGLTGNRPPLRDYCIIGTTLHPAY